MATTNSFGETDLSPRRVGIHFRKLACRSDAVDEGQTEERVNGLDFGARSRSTGPPHEGEPAHPGRLSGRTRGIAGRANPFVAQRSVLEGQGNGTHVAQTPEEEVAPLDATRRSNKRMQLTKHEHNGASQLIRRVGRTQQKMALRTETRAARFGAREYGRLARDSVLAGG